MKTAVRTAIVVLWVLVMALFVRHEAYAERFSRSLKGYRSLLSRDVLVRDSWMRLRFGESPIGYSHTAIGLEEADDRNLFDIRNRTYLKLELLGREQSLHMDSSAVLDLSYDLLRFSFNVRVRGAGGGYALAVAGERVARGEFEVSMETPAGERRLRVAVPPDTVLYSPLTEMALREVKPGQTFALRTLDPASMQPVTVRVRALRRERIAAAGAEHEATVVETDYRGMIFRSWVTSEGQVLRQETPFGWTLEACTPEEALRAVAHSAAAGGAGVEDRVRELGGSWGGGLLPGLLPGPAEVQPDEAKP